MTRISRTFCMLILSMLGLSACGATSSEGRGNQPPPPADNELAWDEGNWNEENWQ